MNEKIRWRLPKLKAECLGQGAAVADGEGLQIPQALASTQDSEHGLQQQVRGGKAHAASHARVWGRPQIADQGEIGCSEGAYQLTVGAIPPKSTHADRSNKRPWNRL